MQLTLLSGGAAQGLVAALAAKFKAETGCDITGTFGAVGAMRDKLIAGAPADLLILTQALIAELARLGHVLPDSPVDLGVVRTGVAVRSGNPKPPIGSAAALRSALLAADAIYFPDPKLATAGIHFAKVLDALGIVGEVAARLAPFPNGAAAMQALARAPDARGQANRSVSLAGSKRRSASSCGGSSPSADFSYTSVPIGTASSRSAPPCPVRFDPWPCCPRSALNSGWKR